MRAAALFYPQARRSPGARRGPWWVSSKSVNYRNAEHADKKLGHTVFAFSRDITGISHASFLRERVGYGMGYAKWDMQKRFLKPAKPVSVLVRELRRPLHCRRSAEAARNSACLSLFISILSLPVSLLPSTCSSLTTVVPISTPAAGIHPHCPYTVPTCRPSATDLSLAMSTQPLTLIFAQPLCPPPSDLPLLPCTPFGAVL